MSSIGSISLSGMNTAQLQLDAAANNVANSETPGYRRREVKQSVQIDGGISATVVRTEQPGASLETDMVRQLQAKNSFLANLAVFKASDAMTGALLDKKV